MEILLLFGKRRFKRNQSSHKADNRLRNDLQKALAVVDNVLIERIKRKSFSKEEEEKLDESQSNEFIKSNMRNKKVKSSQESDNPEQDRKKGPK